jgi:hypothetical protein
MVLLVVAEIGEVGLKNQEVMPELILEVEEVEVLIIIEQIKEEKEVLELLL